MIGKTVEQVLGRGRASAAGFCLLLVLSAGALVLGSEDEDRNAPRGERRCVRVFSVSGGLFGFVAAGLHPGMGTVGLLVGRTAGSIVCADLMRLSPNRTPPLPRTHAPATNATPRP